MRFTKEVRTILTHIHLSLVRPSLMVFACLAFYYRMLKSHLTTNLEILVHYGQKYDCKKEENRQKKATQR